MMFWREGIIVMLLLLCAFLYHEVGVKDKENAQLEIGLLNVKEQIKTIEVDHAAKVAEYEKAIQDKPAVVVELRKIYVKETGNECNDIKSVIAQYRTAIGNRMQRQDCNNSNSSEVCVPDSN